MKSVSGLNKFPKFRPVGDIKRLESFRVVPFKRPHSQYAESRFGGDALKDDSCLLSSGLGRRCERCNAVTKIRFLKKEVCPDCDGRTKHYGPDLRFRERSIFPRNQQTQ